MYNKPISNSGRKLYAKCPKAFHSNYVLGNRRPAGKAAERGTALHLELENAIAGRTPLVHSTLLPWRNFVQGLMIYNPVAEGKLAVNKDWEPVAFDSPEAYYRGMLDVNYILGETLVILDWKSGKVYDDHYEQGMDYAALSPESKYYRTQFVYLDHPPKVLEFDYNKAEIEEHRIKLIDIVETIRNDEEWKPTPSEFSCRWCDLSWRRGGKCESAP